MNDALTPRVSLDDFLTLSDRAVLTNPGRVSHQSAEKHAHAEFAKHDAARLKREATQPTSDFDKAVEHLQTLAKHTSPPRKRKPRSGEEA